MGRLISDHMLVVFFTYGLAFFLLGVAILLQRRLGSVFKLGNSLWLLAAFGLSHGLGEWMDMFLTLGDTYWTPLGTQVIKIASFYFGAASYVCLLQFGLRIILQNRSKYEFLERTALIASLSFLVGVTLYGVSTGFNGQWLLMSQVLMRYLLGFPGAILAAIGFWQQRKSPEIQGLSSYHVDRSLMGMATIFALYAFFAGLLVPSAPFFPASVLNYATFKDAVGIPVQIFRMACALLAAHFITGILNIFNLESQSTLEKANARLSQTNQQLEQGVGERTLQLAQALMILRATLEATTDGILVTDEKLKVVDSNAKYTDMWKIPREIIKAGEPREFVSQKFADPQRFTARIEEIGVTDQESFDLLEPKDGQIFERYSKVLTVEGKRAGRVWSFRDVTERHLAEITARRLAAIVASTDDAIIGIDLNGIITDWNSGAERLFGYSADEMIGASIIRLVPADRQEEELEMLSRIRRGERGEHFDSIRLARGERPLNCAITVSPIKDSGGHVVGSSKVIRDMTERKRAEQELHNAKKAAEEANKAKSQFLANMSHEIRTPMNGVIGMTGLLLDGDLNPHQRDFAETALASADALLKIINDILDFSKIEAGKLSFELLDFDLIDTVESALDLLAEQAHAKGIELASEMTPDLPTRLRGDPGRLRQILTNLISNAIKFTEGGEVVVSISTESETETHARLRFRVKDSGIGISSEAQEKLFEAFSQADGSMTRKYGGTGLGLAIAKQLAALMDGEIGVQSELGKGSTFWFTAELEKHAGSARDSYPSPQNLAGVRVLAVDDNSTNRRILRLQLDTWKMQVETAADGEEALKMMREAASTKRPYRLALLDVQMPKMDGWMLAHAVQADPALAGTLLIVLTSFGQTLSPAELKAAGIEAYLVKPVKKSRLLDCLVNALGKNNGCEATVAAATVVSLKPRLVLEKAHILLAEDNRVNQKVALARLQKLGCSADAVVNGVEVLDALRRLPYDLILMDCQMPEKDGYEATQAIRQREQSSERPCPWNAPIYIIAMTAHAMEGDREKCLAVGMDDYLSKPVLVPELQAALERWKRAAQHRTRQLGN